MPKATKSAKPAGMKTKGQSRGTSGTGAGTPGPVSFKAVRTTTARRHTDFYAWYLAQANELRVHKPDAIDWEELAEELEAAGACCIMLTAKEGAFCPEIGRNPRPTHGTAATIRFQHRPKPAA